DDKRVDGESVLAFERPQSPLFSGQVESPPRRMKEHTPASGSNQELDRHARAVCAELIASLPADHGIGMTAAIELRTALTQSEQEAAGSIELESASALIEHQFLY